MSLDIALLGHCLLLTTSGYLKVYFFPQKIPFLARMTLLDGKNINNLFPKAFEKNTSLVFPASISIMKKCLFSNWVENNCCNICCSTVWLIEIITQFWPSCINLASRILLSFVKIYWFSLLLLFSFIFTDI